MNEEQKSIWKKPIRLPQLLLVWLGLMAVITLISMVSRLIINADFKVSELTIIGAIGATILLASWILMRWLFCRRNLKRTLFALACFATLIALFYTEENWRGRRALANFKQQWEAKGEHFDYASVVPPVVPDDQNFAMTPLVVDSIKSEYGANVAKQWYGVTLTESERTKLVNRFNFQIEGDYDSKSKPTENGNWEKATKTDLAGWQQYYRLLAAKTNLFSIASQPQSPAQDVLLALSKYDSAVEELRTASKLPYARFPVFNNVDYAFDTLLPHLGCLKSCTVYLRLRTVAELQNGEREKALADTKLAIELSEKIRNEPFLISHLVRIGMVQITLNSIYEGLADHRWSDAELVELNASLGKLDFLEDFEKSLRGERACCISGLEFVRRSRDLGLLQNVNTRKSPRNYLSLLIPDAFFSQNILTAARIPQTYILPMVDSTNHLVSPTEIKRLTDAASADLNQHSFPYKIFARALMPAYENTVKKYVRGQSSVDLARTALALERYRLAHGEFPEALTALEPQFVAHVPHDVIGGQPLKYRRTDDGQFVLYSVGWNEKDDGGVVVFKNGETPSVDINQGDWVWRYPEKPTQK